MFSHTLLLVEDDPKLTVLLRDYLQREGFSVLCADRLASARAALAEQPALVILDRNLGHEDGLTLLNDIAQSATAVLILSAQGDAKARVQGLEAGADDYLAKPFLPKELLLRIQNLLQRKAPPETQTILAYRLDQNAVYKPLQQQLVLDKETPIQLSEAENALFELFCQHPQQTLDRDFLQRRLKGHQHDAENRSMDVRVQRLRHKLKQQAASADWIQTVWGKGYRFQAGVEALAE